MSSVWRCGWLLAACVCCAMPVRAQESSAPAALTLEVPTIQCDATPSSITPNMTTQIWAEGSSASGKTLRYSFLASAGVLTVAGHHAVLKAEVNSPAKIQVTCIVSDDQGQTASKVLTIEVSEPGKTAAPPPPPVQARPPLLGPGAGAVAGAVRQEHRDAAKPAPPPPPVEAIAPAQPAVAAASEYAEGDALTAWKQGLKNGQIEYKVPPQMTASLISPVTVVIHGFADKSGPAIPQASGGGTLPVSSRMKVELLAPDNPGEFAIVPQQSDAIQFIPNDSYTTWAWNVTPNVAATQQRLEIRVSLVYNPKEASGGAQGSGDQLDEVLEEKSYPVNVTVQALGTTIRQSFWKDPLAWFKYVLPGGEGWGALAALVAACGGVGGIVAWFRKRGKTGAETSKEEDDEKKGSGG